MPSNWLTADANLPTFTGDEPLKEQVKVVLEYMVTLTENLRYSLQNLGEDNWNNEQVNAFAQKITAQVRQDQQNLTRSVSQLSDGMKKLSESVGANRTDLNDTQATVEQLRTTLNTALGNLETKLTKLEEKTRELEQILRQGGGVLQRLAELEGLEIPEEEPKE